MHNNPVLPTFHYLPDDRSTLDPLPGVRCESNNEESASGPDILHERTDYLSDIHRPRQGSHPPNALAESVDGETDPAWMTNPPSQEVLEGTGILDAALCAYPPYSVGPHSYTTSCFSYCSHFDQDPPPTAREFVSQTMSRTALSYPVRQMANTPTDIGLFGFPAEMERQLAPEMTYTDRSLSGASSALDRDGLAAWPGPGHIPSTSDCCDHISFGLLPNSLEGPSSQRSVSRSLIHF